MANIKHITYFGLINKWVRLPALILLLASILSSNSLYADNETVVLITHRDSAISTISKLDIRRIYLGITPISANQVKNPVLNMSDKALFNDFIKNVMHMTEDGYKRKVIKRVFRRGSNYIQEAFTTDEIIAHLMANKNDISYIRTSEIKGNNNIKIIATLW